MAQGSNLSRGIRTHPARRPTHRRGHRRPGDGHNYPPHDFYASAGPLTATQPIVYIWRVDEQTVVHTGNLSDTATFDRPAPDAQVFTITAINAGGMVSNTYVITTHTPLAGTFYLPLIKTDMVTATETQDKSSASTPETALDVWRQVQGQHFIHDSVPW